MAAQSKRRIVLQTETLIIAVPLFSAFHDGSKATLDAGIHIMYYLSFNCVPRP
jgi:hypothetical protein